MLKLDSISFRHDGESLTGLAVALSKNCRSPFYEGRNAKKKVKPVMVDLSQFVVKKIGLKVSLEQGDSADVFYGIRIYTDKGTAIDQEFNTTKKADWEYQ